MPRVTTKGQVTIPKEVRDALVSFDSGFYGTYFPSLTVRPA